jgi:hypothetical protein
LTEPVVFGCDYCRDDQNRFYGHITQLGSNEERRTLLLRCPQCGSLYENSARGEDQTKRLTTAQAAALFPEVELGKELKSGDLWLEVKRLWNEKMDAPFPDCRGEEIDGVDLVMLDSDLAGCVMHFLGERYGTDEFQKRILERVFADLTRIVPKMTGEVAEYFSRELLLAAATLGSLADGARP